jgi:hypothetical protein
MIVLFSNSAFANIENHRNMIIDASNAFGINPAVLATIVTLESNGNPWTFNVDGEGLQFNSRADATNKFNYLMKNRWMIKFKNKRNMVVREFFPSKVIAQQWISSFNKNNSYNFSITEKKVVNVKSGQMVLRKLRLINTDIGLSQINFRWHGKQYKDKFGFYDWLSPELNLYYAAKHIKELYQRHGKMYKAVAHYHSSTKYYQDIYLKKFKKIYQAEINKNRV